MYKLVTAQVSGKSVMDSAPRGIRSSLEAKPASLKRKRGMDHTDTFPSKHHFVDAQPSPPCLLIPLERKRKWENDFPETPSNKRRCLNGPLSEVISRPPRIPTLKRKREDEITESHPSKRPNLRSTSRVADLESYTPVAVFPQVSNLMTS